jgi:hypothetical protein
MYLLTCGVVSPQITKEDWARKSQIRKVPHLLKVRKSNNLYKSANLRFAELICGPPTFDITRVFICHLTKLSYGIPRSFGGFFRHLPHTAPGQNEWLELRVWLALVNQEGEKFKILKLFINVTDQVISNGLNSPLKLPERIGRSIKNRVYHDAQIKSVKNLSLMRTASTPPPTLSLSPLSSLLSPRPILPDLPKIRPLSPKMM